MIEYDREHGILLLNGKRFELTPKLVPYCHKCRSKLKEDKVEVRDDEIEYKCCGSSIKYASKELH